LASATIGTSLHALPTEAHSSGYRAAPLSKVIHARPHQTASLEPGHRVVGGTGFMLMALQLARLAHVLAFRHER
jgi:hypothetical protein